MRRVLLVLILTGCGVGELRDAVTEGRALLADPVAGQVNDPDWQLRRAKFLADADAVAPEKS